jgi:hypothetical protein
MADQSVPAADTVRGVSKDTMHKIVAEVLYQGEGT